MRVTNAMITNNYMNNLNQNLERMNDLQNQVATNKRITKLSDDPVGVISSMEARTKLNQIDQYDRNIDSSMTWLEQSESAILEMNEIVQSAYEMTVHIANEFMTETDKLAAAEEIAQYKEHILQVGNSKSGDKYVFGGFNVNTPPFTLNGSGDLLYNGLDLTNAADPLLIAEKAQVVEFEIGLNMKTQASITGPMVMDMGPDNVYQVLADLEESLRSNASVDEIGSYISKLQGNQSHLMSVDAELGGRMNRLDLIKNRYEDDFLSYTELKSNIEDADLAEVTMNWKMAEAVYLAALGIGQKIIQPSLVNYLQ